MHDKNSLASKPRSKIYRPGLTHLPKLTARRLILRQMMKCFARLVVAIWTRTEVIGLERFPREGPALIVSNHLGDADWIVGIAISPVFVETVAKVELYDIPGFGRLMDAYGVIWVHRGQPDRQALRAVLEGLQQGRIVGIAPEARESLTGALEEGTEGAAYLALKADVPLIPVTFTGTENQWIYGNIKHFRRTAVRVTVGSPFKLNRLPDRKAAIEAGTQQIMRTLAAQLPPEHRGMHHADVEEGKPVTAGKGEPDRDILQ